jgi:rhodanese-related sulfurtransferase
MVTAIDRIGLLRLIEEEDAQIVDVLPAPEYAESHIPGAINIPLRHLDAESASVLSRDKPVVVY